MLVCVCQVGEKGDKIIVFTSRNMRKTTSLVFTRRYEGVKTKLTFVKKR